MQKILYQWENYIKFCIFQIRINLKSNIGIKSCAILKEILFNNYTIHHLVFFKKLTNEIIRN